MSRVACSLFFVAISLVAAPPVAPQVSPPLVVLPPPMVFEAPVDAAVVDGWRPPGTPYGPGNRGWEYITEPSTPARAAGDGVVTFAGVVAEEQYVTVVHRGGIRTSYSYLESITVAEGDEVERGQTLGTTGERLHFGVRLGGEYVDPGVLFRPDALRVRARLVPTES